MESTVTTYNPTSTSNYTAYGLNTDCVNYSGDGGNRQCLFANNEIRIFLDFGPITNKTSPICGKYMV